MTGIDHFGYGDGMDSPGTPTLRSPRFVLRQLERSDAAALLHTFADPISMQWWSRAPFDTEAELAEWLVPDSGWYEGRSWAIVEGVKGPAIGRVAVMDRGDDVAEIAYLSPMPVVARASLAKRWLL